MKDEKVRDFLLILLVAFLWFVGGWCMGVGIQAQFEGNWIMSCSSINLLDTGEKGVPVKENGL